MAKLILQMQMSVDGYIASGRDLPWTLWDWTWPSPWSEALLAAFNATFTDVDAILLSRDMAEGGYIDHWTSMHEAHGAEPGYEFLGRVVEAEKIVVTRRPFAAPWPRTRVVTEPFAGAVAAARQASSGSVICFGGVRFSQTLLREGLVDELHAYVNPALPGEGESLGRGMPARMLDLISSTGFDDGMVVNTYAVGGRRAAG